MRTFMKNYIGVIRTHSEWESTVRDKFILFTFLFEFIPMFIFSVFMWHILYTSDELRIYLLYVLILAGYSLFRSLYLYKYYKKHFSGTKESIKNFSKTYMFVEACAIGLMVGGAYVPISLRMFENNLITLVALILLTMTVAGIWSFLTGAFLRISSK